MRRVLSILLLVALSTGPAEAAAMAVGLISGPASVWTGKVDESRLPACCRRNGKHHCAMSSMASQEQSTGSGEETTVYANDACPFPPRIIASTAPSVAAAIDSAECPICIASELRTVQISDASALFADLRSWPKRGPPVQHLL